MKKKTLIYRYGMGQFDRNDFSGSMEAVLNKDGEIMMPPSKATLVAPPKSKSKSKIAVFDEETQKWKMMPLLKDTTIRYRDKIVGSKADVDEITEAEIVALGESKAKTLYLIVFPESCPEWDTFVESRQALIDEGDKFISANLLV
jgi:hypothetical protein